MALYREWCLGDNYEKNSFGRLCYLDSRFEHIQVRNEWLSDDQVQAVRYGNFVANFVQVSDYYPVDNRGHKAELEDATSVLVVDKVGLRTYVDSNETPLEVIALSGERKGQTVFVNELDLTIVY